MYRLDDSQFPIFTLATDDSPATLNDMREFEASLRAALDRRAPFGIIAFITTENETKPDKEVTKASNDIIKRLKPELSQWCVGYAGVTQVGKWIKLYKPIAHIMARNRMGCDGALFEHETDARAWLTTKLAERAAKVPA